MISDFLPIKWILLFTLFLNNFDPNAFVTSSLTKPDRVKLETNGYTGVVVIIHEDVPENEELVSIINNQGLLISPFAPIQNILVSFPRNAKPKLSAS